MRTIATKNDYEHLIINRLPSFSVFEQKEIADFVLFMEKKHMAQEALKRSWKPVSNFNKKQFEADVEEAIHLARHQSARAR
jgi:hypothetical protein